MTTELVSQLESLHRDAFGWALHCCHGDDDMAGDVLQLAYAKVMQERVRFHGESALKTWWFGVLRYTALEEFRKRRLRNSVLGKLLLLEPAPGASSSPNPREEAEQSEQTLRLRAMLRQLSPRQAEVLHLVFYQDMTIADAAEVMKVSLGSARQHYERAKARLRILIQKEAETAHEFIRST